MRSVTETYQQFLLSGRVELAGPGGGAVRPQKPFGGRVLVGWIFPKDFQVWKDRPRLSWRGLVCVVLPLWHFGSPLHHSHQRGWEERKVETSPPLTPCDCLPPMVFLQLQLAPP